MMISLNWRMSQSRRKRILKRVICKSYSINLRRKKKKMVAKMTKTKRSKHGRKHSRRTLRLLLLPVL